MTVGTVQYQSVQNFTQSQAGAPPPAAAAFEARNVSVGVTQTEAAVRAPDNTNKNQEAREARRERVDRDDRPRSGPRGQNVDISV
ncbi:MAG: hypothetical protein AB7G06_08790 [Bdellovibrionales bacterium]